MGEVAPGSEDTGRAQPVTDRAWKWASVRSDQSQISFFLKGQIHGRSSLKRRYRIQSILLLPSLANVRNVFCCEIQSVQRM